MRILFAITHLGFLRNFESTLALLAERGHVMHLVTDRRAQKGVVTDGTPVLDRLSARFPNAFTTETVPAADARCLVRGQHGGSRDAELLAVPGASLRRCAARCARVRATQAPAATAG